MIQLRAFHPWGIRAFLSLRWWLTRTKKELKSEPKNDETIGKLQDLSYRRYVVVGT